MQHSLAAVLAVGGLTQAAFAFTNSSSQVVTDLGVIQRYWGQLSPYFDNDESYFGVQDVGLPDGCGIEQSHTLQRHAQRFPTSAFDDGANDENFAGRVANWTGAAGFTGPLSFLNTYRYLLNESYLTNVGASTEFSAGVSFWNRYGRLLYDAVPGQLAYDANYPNGTARPRPVLRTTSQSRIWNSQINWALGFFGTSFQLVPDPTLAGVDSPFDLVVIPEGGTENNTLASYDSCTNEYSQDPILYTGDYLLETYIPKYLAAATERLGHYVPSGFDWTANDTYAMQSICAYETAYIGDSNFCGLFTLDEWAGFESTLDTEYYYDYGYGNPTGRAQGIGYLQELLARLQNQYIDVSNSSVNSTLTDNPTTFPLGQKFYADFSHDDIIISVLTAMSVDYFKDAPDLNQVSRRKHRPAPSPPRKTEPPRKKTDLALVPPRPGQALCPLAPDALRRQPHHRGHRVRVAQPGREPAPRRRVRPRRQRVPRRQRHAQVRPAAPQPRHRAPGQRPRRRLRGPDGRAVPPGGLRPQPGEQHGPGQLPVRVLRQLHREHGRGAECQGLGRDHL